MHSWSIGKNATLSKKNVVLLGWSSPKKDDGRMFERAQWLLVGIPRRTKISISHRCSFHQHSLLKIIQDDGVVSILTRFLDISLTNKECLDPIFSERGNSWKLQCVLSSDWCTLHFFKGNCQQLETCQCIFSKTLHISACSPTQLLPGACPPRMPVHGVDACFFRMSSLANCHKHPNNWTDQGNGEKEHVTCTNDTNTQIWLHNTCKQYVCDKLYFAYDEYTQK